MKGVLKINNAVMPAQVHNTKPDMHEAFIKVTFDKIMVKIFIDYNKVLVWP